MLASSAYEPCCAPDCAMVLAKDRTMRDTIHARSRWRAQVTDQYAERPLRNDFTLPSNSPLTPNLCSCWSSWIEWPMASNAADISKLTSKAEVIQHCRVHVRYYSKQKGLGASSVDVCRFDAGRDWLTWTREWGSDWKTSCKVGLLVGWPSWVWAWLENTWNASGNVKEENDKLVSRASGAERRCERFLRSQAGITFNRLHLDRVQASTAEILFGRVVRWSDGWWLLGRRANVVWN